MVKILPTITSVSSDWENKIEEVEKLKLSEVCLFLTGLSPLQRPRLFKQLGKIKKITIPFVHLRADVSREEMELLLKKYQTQKFNLHSPAQFPLNSDLLAYRSLIYLENLSHQYLEEKEVKAFAGVCVDFAHLENSRLRSARIYQNQIKIIKKYSRGCGHLSAVGPKLIDYGRSGKSYDSHDLEQLNQVDYLKRYRRFFPPLIAIELENSLEEQLKVKKYLKSLMPGIVR